MRAVLLTSSGITLADVPEPVLGPGQVVVRTSAAGLCHSDLTLAARPPGAHPFDLPFVLGHELAGSVAEVSPDVAGLEVGDPVVGYGPRGCGTCTTCRSGEENYCRHRPSGVFSPGIGSDGPLATGGEMLAVDGCLSIVGSGEWTPPPIQRCDTQELRC